MNIHRLRRSFALVLPLSLTTVALADVTLFDGFADGVVGARYGTIGGASLTEVGGQLVVTTSSAGDGLVIDLTDVGATAECHILTLSTNGSSSGDSMVWSWIVEDQDANVFPLLVMTLTQGSITADVKKHDKDGNVVGTQTLTFTEEQFNTFVSAQFKWDRRTRNGVEEVQLELLDDMGNVTKLFPWSDPPPTTTVGFTITTNLDTFALDEIRIDDSHQPVPVPALGARGLLPLALMFLLVGAWAATRLARRTPVGARA